jgi:hypothetical protein
MSLGTYARPLDPGAGAFLVRFLLLSAALGYLAMRDGHLLAAALLPLFKAEIQWADDALRVDSLELADDHGERVIRLDVGLAHSVNINERTFRPDPRGKAMSSTLVGNLAVPTVLLISTAFAFPGRKPFAYLRRALWMLPTLLLLWMVGVPLVLWASIWRLLVEAADPTRFSPLLLWANFVLGGGELAVAVALGLCIARTDSRPLFGTESASLGPRAP